MQLKFASESKLAIWNKLILANPDEGNILQSAEMADIKKLGGWTPRYIVADSLAILALERSVPLLGKFWYVIKGPGLISARELDALLPELKMFAASHGVFMIKIEPEIVKTDETIIDFMKLGLLKVRNIQPNVSTIMLDISGDIDSVMARLNQKGRHAIKRAQRDGAVVKAVPASEANCREMYRLYKITAEGQFAARPYKYYKNFWQSFEKAQMGQMFFAYVDDQVVAAAYALIFGTKSTYKDGASLRERPVYGVSHLLQWHIIEWAKSRGAVVHDLCGSPPSDQLNNENHPYYGFGRFKSSFSRNVVDFVGAYDIIVRPYRYRLWITLGERIMLRLHAWRFRESYY